MSCSENNYVDEYGKYLGVNFPSDMNQVYINQQAYFQDYSNHSIYDLTLNQRDSIINQIKKLICDTAIAKNNNCWENKGECYFYKISDSTKLSGYYLKAILITSDEINTLNIFEAQW